MTVTLEFVAGSESDGANSCLSEWSGNVTVYGGAVSSPTARPYTGARELRCNSGSGNYGQATVYRNITPTYQGRLGFFLYTDFAQGGSISPGSGLFRVMGSSELFCLRWPSGSTNLQLVLAGTSVVGTWSSQVSGAYHYLSVDFKIDPTAGWVNVWSDGVLMLSFSGNTGSTPAAAVYVGQFYGYGAGGAYAGGNNQIDVDDCAFYDTTGEAAPLPLDSYRFLWFEYTADGAMTTCTPSTGSSHVAMIDEIPDDGDATYNYATADGQIDVFSHAAFALPAGYGIVAVIPTMIARKTDAALATQVAGYAVQGSSAAAGSAQGLGSSYAAVTASAIAADPATGAAWTQAGVNSAQFGYASEGTF